MCLMWRLGTITQMCDYLIVFMLNPSSWTLVMRIHDASVYIWTWVCYCTLSKEHLCMAPILNSKMCMSCFTHTSPDHWQKSGNMIHLLVNILKRWITGNMSLCMPLCYKHVIILINPVICLMRWICHDSHW